MAFIDRAEMREPVRLRHGRGRGHLAQPRPTLPKPRQAFDWLERAMQGTLERASLESDASKNFHHTANLPCRCEWESV